MALAQPGAGDADEARAPSSPRSSARRSSPSPAAGRRRAGGRSAPSGPLYGDAALDALRDELRRRPRRRPGSSGPSRTTRAFIAPSEPMPRYSLKRSPWTTIDVARRLVGAGEHRAEHDGVGAGRDRLRDVARRGDAAVGDHRHAVVGRDRRDVVDRRDLRHADAGDDARRADRPGPDARPSRRRRRRRSAPRRPRRSRCCPRRPRRRGASLSRRTISSTPREWPCAVSTTSTSTPASTSAAARSTASGPTPTAAPTRSRPLLVLRRVRVLDRASGCP